MEPNLPILNQVKSEYSHIWVEKKMEQAENALGPAKKQQTIPKEFERNRISSAFSVLYGLSYILLCVYSWLVGTAHGTGYEEGSFIIYPFDRVSDFLFVLIFRIPIVWLFRIILIPIGLIYLVSTVNGRVMDKYGQVLSVVTLLPLPFIWLVLKDTNRMARAMSPDVYRRLKVDAEMVVPGLGIPFSYFVILGATLIAAGMALQRQIPVLGHFAPFMRSKRS